MPKEKESFSEQLRIRRAKEERKKMNLQERIEFLKDEKKEKLEKIGIKEKNKLEDKLRLGIVADINNNGVNVLKFNNGERQFLSLFNYREKMIKKIEDLKRCQIVCKNIVKRCAVSFLKPASINFEG